jgi:hypothetical protein
MAFFVLAQDSTTSADDIASWSRERMADDEVPAAGRLSASCRSMPPAKL